LMPPPASPCNMYKCSRRFGNLPRKSILVNIRRILSFESSPTTWPTLAPRHTQFVGTIRSEMDWLDWKSRARGVWPWPRASSAPSGLEAGAYLQPTGWVWWAVAHTKIWEMKFYPKFMMYWLHIYYSFSNFVSHGGVCLPSNYFPRPPLVGGAGATKEREDTRSLHERDVEDENISKKWRVGHDHSSGGVDRYLMHKDTSDLVFFLVFFYVKKIWKNPHIVNDVFHKRVKYQLQILYILSYTRIIKV
jgi:hypothetical protein